MKYKIEQVSGSMRLIKPRRWWNDPLKAEDVVAALTEVSKFGRIVSVLKIGGFFSIVQFLVIVEEK